MPISDRVIGTRSLRPVGLGCMNLSHAYLPRPDQAYGVKLLHRTIDAGYQHFDSARLYGLGKNEMLLSQVLKTRRDEMYITSKCGIEFDNGERRIDCRPDIIRSAVDKSLQALGVDYLDLYYLHRKDFNTPIEEGVGTLADLKKEGKIGGIGLSEMSAQTLLQAETETHIDAMQSEYSLWTRNPEIGVLEACKSTGTAFIAFSPIARGVLAGSVTDPALIPEGDLRTKQPRFNTDNWAKNYELVKKFDALAKAADVTPAQLALFWVLAQGDNVHVIPGTKSIDHMIENFQTLQLDVSENILKMAGEIVNHTTVSGHRYPEAARKAIDTEDFQYHGSSD